MAVLLRSGIVGLGHGHGLQFMVLASVLVWSTWSWSWSEVLGVGLEILLFLVLFMSLITMKVLHKKKTVVAQIFCIMAMILYMQVQLVQPDTQAALVLLVKVVCLDQLDLLERPDHVAIPVSVLQLLLLLLHGQTREMTFRQ